MMDIKKGLMIFWVSVLLTGGWGSLCAAEAGGPDFHEFELWHKLLPYSLSPDGRWVYWRVQSSQDSDTLFIRDMKSGKEYAYGGAAMPQFSGDSHWIAFSLPASPTGSAGAAYQIRLVRLETGEECDFKGMESFSFTADSRYLLLKGRNEEAAELNLYQLNSKKIKNLSYIREYTLDPTGKYLAYVVKTPKGIGNGIEVADLTDFRILFQQNDPGEYEKLKWTRQGLMYMRVLPDSIPQRKNREIRIVKGMESQPRFLVLTPADLPDFPGGMVISSYYDPHWSKDGKILFFGISKEQNRKKEHTAPGADADIWHWQDQEIQSRQKHRYYVNRSRTYLCAWWPEQQKWRQIADSSLYEVAGISANGTYVLMEDEQVYRPHYREPHRDIYLISTLTGNRHRILENTILSADFSREGKYVYYFKDKNWWVYDIAREKYINVTAGINTELSNIHYDGPIDIPPSFGAVGWTEGDREFCFYDEYDMWKIEPEKLRVLRLTKGREKKITYRKMQRGQLSLDRSLLFKASGADGQAGVFRFDPQLRHQLLLWGPYTYLRIDKAAKAEASVWAREDNIHSPELFYSTKDFSKPVQLTHTNLFPPGYHFRKSELITYQNAQGKTLKGALFYPVNYQQGVKYPMIVSVYETLSQQLNAFVFPEAGDAYNPMNYVLNGYFVFQPDITYEINHPGESAADCVSAALREVLKNEDIDSRRLGLIGHSWGAYQTAYLITRSSEFAAAVAGAPLTNMISMYNSIYWENGRPNQEMFETSQARFRLPWWQIPQCYMDNSPVFRARHIHTPLLMLFGTADEAVSWSQGLELYITMRRLGKPCILIAYDEEGHTIGSKENRLDQSRRVMDYFDYYLKGNPAKEWILKGRSYLEKQGEE